MTLKAILRRTMKHLVVLELWETDKTEHRTLTSCDQEFDNYLYHEVAQIIPTIYCYKSCDSVGVDECVTKPTLKICIDLFD